MTIKINKPYTLKQFITEDKYLSERYNLLNKNSKNKFLKFFYEYTRCFDRLKKIKHTEEFAIISEYLKYYELLKKVYDFKDFSLIKKKNL